jgi:replicative DNA helicase
VDIEEFERWHSNTFSGKQPFHIISTDSLGGEVTPEVIRSKIDQYQPDIVVADYMQLMSPNSKADSEVVRMKNLSRELKLLAMSERVPIIAISSATPTDAADLSSAPTLGQTAWSRQIAYDADWLLSLGRDLNSNAMEVVGRKNREGMLPDFLLEVDFDKGVFKYKGFPDDM